MISERGEILIADQPLGRPLVDPLLPSILALRMTTDRSKFGVWQRKY